MPDIRPSAYIRNDYNEIYNLLDESLEGEKHGEYSDFDEFMAEFRAENFL